MRIHSHTMPIGAHMTHYVETIWVDRLSHAASGPAISQAAWQLRPYEANASVAPGQGWLACSNSIIVISQPERDLLTLLCPAGCAKRLNIYIYIPPARDEPGQAWPGQALWGGALCASVTRYGYH